MFTVSPSNHLNLQKHFESSGRRFFPISGSGSRFRVRKARVSRCGSLVGGSGSTRTVIRSQKNTVEPAASPSKKRGGNESSTISSSSSSGGIDVRAMIRIRKKMKEKLTEKIEDQWEYFVNGIGHGISIRLISEEIDPETNSGRSIESCVKGWLPKPHNGVHALEYAANFTVPRNFGSPGAVLITNLHGKEFYLLEVIVHGFDDGPIFFPANTWIHSRKDNSDSRIIFKNHAYLPSQTPAGLVDLRSKDLSSIRGNGKGERKPYDRIYDYDVYNDLGNPDKSKDLARPVLGFEERPYPRRCRTGRPPTVSDPLTESRIEKPHPVYVPRDETFEEIKQNTFSAGRLKALVHNLVPSIAATLSKSDISFKCFSEIDKLYIDGVVLNDENHQEDSQKFFLGNIMKQVVNAGQTLLKYEIPAVIKSDRFSWLRDHEFARQTLAGVNPVNIECLREFPIRSKLDPNVYGPPESAITKELIEKELYNGMSIEQAIEEKRLFILDYHEILLPFIKKINALPGRKVYASRTVFFYSQTGSLRPLAIELSLPPTPSSKTNKHVYTHGHDATTHWIWKLAKAHVCSVDAGIHQLVNHWLRTHASMEPYIIATHRQLSFMHPIYKLLHPHMRYTLEINALARQNLINGGGIIEASFLGGKYSMELSSAAYKSMWRFDMEALPADLIRRGMAVEDPSMPNGVRLVIEDYPYAADGLLIWSAIKEWVESYVEHFYSEPNSITNDVELQAWWSEIKNKGHPEKRNEPWWPKLNTKEDLSGILTTMIWVASGQHAAINFGQYPFGSYVPNRPTLMRKLMPREGDHDYENFIANPQRTFLSSLPTQLQATKVMAVQDTLSTHSPDEEYLGQVNQLHRSPSASLPFSLCIPCLTISETLHLPMETILSPHSLSPLLNPKPSSSSKNLFPYSFQPRPNFVSLSKPISLSLKTPSPPNSLRSSLPAPSAWLSHLQHGLAAVAISLALNFSPLLAGHNALASEFDVLNDGPPKESHVVDDAGVLSRVTKSDLKRLLTDLESRKNFHIDFVTVRKLTSKADAFEYADQVLERWYPTVEDGNNKGIVVLVTSQKEGAITGGPAFIQAVGENILDATVTENLPVLATDEKYNEAIYSSAKRLVAAIDGLPDPGGPSFKDNKRESNFKTREETEEKRGQFSLVVGGLLVIAFVVPMAQYYAYVSRK